MTGFVYRWTNNINGKWYVGSHKGTPDDGYRHSSVSLAFAEEKYGIENFTREILFEGDYEKDKIRSVVESEFLRAENAAHTSMSYNLTNITGPDCFSEESRKKQSIALRGNTNGKGNKGKLAPQNKTHRQNISKSMRGNIPWNKNKTCPGLSHALLGNTNGRGKKGKSQRIIACPRCDKAGGVSNMKRYHFNNCKEENKSC